MYIYFLIFLIDYYLQDNINNDNENNNCYFITIYLKIISIIQYNIY